MHIRLIKETQWLVKSSILSKRSKVAQNLRLISLVIVLIDVAVVYFDEQDEKRMVDWIDSVILFIFTSAKTLSSRYSP